MLQLVRDTIAHRSAPRAGIPQPAEAAASGPGQASSAPEHADVVVEGLQAAAADASKLWGAAGAVGRGLVAASAHDDHLCGSW